MHAPMLTRRIRTSNECTGHLLTVRMHATKHAAHTGATWCSVASSSMAGHSDCLIKQSMPTLLAHHAHVTDLALIRAVASEVAPAACWAQPVLGALLPQLLVGPDEPVACQEHVVHMAGRAPIQGWLLLGAHLVGHRSRSRCSPHLQPSRPTYKCALLFCCNKLLAHSFFRCRQPGAACHHSATSLKAIALSLSNNYSYNRSPSLWIATASFRCHHPDLRARGWHFCGDQGLDVDGILNIAEYPDIIMSVFGRFAPSCLRNSTSACTVEASGGKCCIRDVLCNSLRCINNRFSHWGQLHNYLAGCLKYGCQSKNSIVSS